MFSPSEMAGRICDRAEEMGYSVRALLIKADLGRNTINHLRNGSSLGYDSLARLAMILDCSMDYLAGLSNVPNMENNGPALDERENELLNMYRVLDFGGKGKVDALVSCEYDRVRLEGDSTSAAT